MADHGLECASRHFRVRRGRHLRGRWTWRQARENATRLGERRWVRSRPDYIMIPAAERKRVKSVRRIFPPHHRSDHRALVMRVWGRRGVKRYVRKRETLPVQPSAAGERSEEEEMFAELAAAINKPPRREWAENAWIRPGTWAAADTRKPPLEKPSPKTRRKVARRRTASTTVRKKPTSSTPAAKQLQSSSHRGICSIQRALTSIAEMNSEEALPARTLLRDAARQGAFLRELVSRNS